jgi:hypothetical protein
VGQDQFGVGLFDGLLEETAFEHVAGSVDAGFETAGKIRVLIRQGQLQADLG